VSESTAPADPVFVDRTGRRRRVLAAAGVIGGLALILAALALVAGLTGAGAAAVPGWPAADRPNGHLPRVLSTSVTPASRSPAAPADRPARSTTPDAPAATTPAPPTATATSASATPARTPNSHRHVPTRTA
jgi:hypothetical protein